MQETTQLVQPSRRSRQPVTVFSRTREGTISETVTIPINGSHLVIVPAGVRLDVTFDNTVIETLGWKVNLTPYGINADPASLNS